MKNLNRNKQQIYHSEYLGTKVPILDDGGFETGEYTTSYSEPAEFWINVSPPDGEMYADAFGGITNYDRVMSTNNVQCPIALGSRIWYKLSDTEKPFNYEVVAVADSLNVIRYAIESRTVNHG